MEKRDKIFVNGMISNEVPETAPDFILGKGAFKVDDLINFLNSNKEYAVNGYLNYTILRSKTSGKRYVELDLYQYDKNRSSSLSPEDIAIIREAREREIGASIDPATGGEGIPF